jgi:hypothetical protein
MKNEMNAATPRQRHVDTRYDKFRFQRRLERSAQDTAMVSSFFKKAVVSEVLSRVKERKQENLLLLSAC